MENGSQLASHLLALFAEAEDRRRDVEDRWLRDLRQYKGIYDPEVAARIHPRRSRAFVRLTRAKVRLADARLMDLLFPAGGEDNWSIRPTPLPELPQERRRELTAELRRQLGREPDEAEVLAAESRAADAACEAMARRIRDQLAQSRYREVLREVIHSGNLYGTGVLKGPLVERRAARRWERRGPAWQLAGREELAPYLEFVPLWDIYPDMAASRLRDARFVFQRHVMTRPELERLAGRPDFDGPAILAHAASNPEGTPDPKVHEAELSGMAGQGPVLGEHRYQLLEFWGHLPGRLLAQAGVEVRPEDLEREVPATVWLLGSQVVKALASPLCGVRWPYSFYCFDKDETSIFGEGLAAIMRDLQQLFNASVRAMLDNAAISAGPQLEVNQDLLPEHEDPTDIYPFRIWLRSGRGAEAQSPAVRVNTLPSYVEQFMAMARLFEAYGHETTGIPSAMQAELEGAAGTVRGLSMLMGAISVPLRDQVKNFDDGITRPFITALYHWNMQFSPDPAVKGDFAVQARGWTALVAREVAVEQLDAFAASTANSLDAPYVRRGELLRQRALARGLPAEVVRGEQDVRPEAGNAEAR